MLFGYNITYDKIFIKKKAGHFKWPVFCVVDGCERGNLSLKCISSMFCRYLTLEA